MNFFYFLSNPFETPIPKLPLKENFANWKVLGMLANQISTFQ